MITGKLNLMNLMATRKVLTGKTGPVECLVIPIANNSLFVGEKGVYLDLIAFELKNKEEGKDTHLIKQSLPKEVRENMSKEELDSMPIIGNLRITAGGQERDSVSSMEVQEEESDLPF